MKFGRKLCSFIIVFVSILCVNNAKAEEKALCPEGCFCLNEGRVNLDHLKKLFGITATGYDAKLALKNLTTKCKTPSSRFKMISVNNLVAGTGFKTDTGEFQCDFAGYIQYGTQYDTLICNREKYFSTYAADWNDKFSYFLEDFSELYSGSFGIYGIINNEPIYISESAYYDHTFQCPFSHPLSKPGAKTIYDCFKYGDKQNVIYYGRQSEEQSCVNDNLSIKGSDGWVAGAICEPGYYMPSGITECKLCTSGNKACPGGLFYTDKTYEEDRGTIECASVNSSRTACNTSHKIDSWMHDNALSKEVYRGWIPIVNCEPGTYMPANATKCTLCLTNSTCPGGLFYTDKTYTVDRGIEKGKSETAIISDQKIKVTSVKPSKMQSGIRKASKAKIYR